jgi:hypothetical protein
MPTGSQEVSKRLKTALGQAEQLFTQPWVYPRPSPGERSTEREPSAAEGAGERITNVTKRIRRPTEASLGKRCDTGMSQEGMRCLYPDSRAAPGWTIWEWDALRTPSSATAVTKPQGARIQLIGNWMMRRFVLQVPRGSQMSLQTASVSTQLLDDHVLFVLPMIK